MKKLIIVVMLFILTTGLIAQAETLTPEQTAARSLIKSLYEIDPGTFEYATFGAKYRNGEEVVEGKHDPERQCKLLAKFLVNEAVIHVETKGIKRACMTITGGFIRYPSADDEELSPATRYAPLPIPHINTPAVDGDKAKVHVTFPKVGANVMYYLRKQPEGWRIYRVESSENSATIETMGQGDVVNVFPPEH